MPTKHTVPSGTRRQPGGIISSGVGASSATLASDVEPGPKWHRREWLSGHRAQYSGPPVSPADGTSATGPIETGT